MSLPSAFQFSAFTELPSGADFHWVAKKFIWVFLYEVMKKPKRMFWSPQYFSRCDFSVLSNNRQPSSQGASLPSSWDSAGPQAVTRTPRLSPPPQKPPSQRLQTQNCHSDAQTTLLASASWEGISLPGGRQRSVMTGTSGDFSSFQSIFFCFVSLISLISGSPRQTWEM